MSKRNIGPSEIIAVGYREGKEHEKGLDVSSMADEPYNLFSPFSYSPDYQIPVPGFEGMYSNSVESIWQGLKIIKGSSDPAMFNSKPRKRKGRTLGFMFGNKILGITEARSTIYKPAYFYHINNNISENIKDSVLLQALKEGVAFYDVEENLNVNNPSKSLAHSTFLAEYFNNYLNDKISIERKKLKKDYIESEFPHETLAEPIARSLKRLESSEVSKEITKFFLSMEHSELNDFHKRFYSRLLQKLMS